LAPVAAGNQPVLRLKKAVFERFLIC